VRQGRQETDVAAGEPHRRAQRRDRLGERALLLQGQTKPCMGDGKLTIQLLGPMALLDGEAVTPGKVEGPPERRALER
jgi:hypothetical protein